MATPRTSPSWCQVARQPRYLAGLALAILAALTFALLANWQWSRTLTPIPAPPQQYEPAPLDELILPGGLLPAELINRPVEFAARVDFSQTYVVAGRRQLASSGETIAGYWLVANSIPLSSNASSVVDEVSQSSLTLAVYFASDVAILVELSKAMDALAESESQLLQLAGVLVAPEGPRPIDSLALASLSLAQLVNLYSNETLRSYPAAVLLSADSSQQITDELIQLGVPIPSEVQQIQVRYLEEEFEINWLTAFYAVEWLIFAVIAFYIWWRLVSDARARALQN